ncbi:MAG: hypothetical protein HDS64_11810, partial [Bacteroidales bacterium]|nr:hypothetical protein [Bacteroidales bacterium]
DGVLADLHISEREMEIIQEYDLGQDIAIIKQLSDEKLIAAKELFINMAKCDGYADPRELQIISTIA